MPANSASGLRKVRGVTATTFSSYYHYKCDLFLYDSYYGKSSKGSHTESSALVKAKLKRGNNWESQLLMWLDKQNLLVQVMSDTLTATDLQNVIELDKRDHFFISGLCFYPPVDSFKLEYERRGTQMPQFSIAKPDLLEIRRSKDGLYCWQILDAKASMNVKVSTIWHLFIRS